MALEGPLFLGSEIYRGSSYGAWHPLRVPRVSTVMDLSRALGWLPPERFRVSPRAKAAALQVWHTADYIAALQAAESAGEVSDGVRAKHGLGTSANPVFGEMFRRPATGAGASLLAGELLVDGGVIYHPGGGTHHGMPDRANGFCYLNDCVLAILSLRRNGAKRIAYVDIDAHHADGVEHAFGNDPDTLLISTHEDGRWPRTGALEGDGARATVNIPVRAGMTDAEMGLICDGVIAPAVARFAPDALVIQCGADAVEDDPQSRLSLSNRAHLEVLAALKSMAPRLLVLGGGGYNPYTVGRLWTAVWGVLSGQDMPRTLPPEAEAVLRDIMWDGSVRARNPKAAWFTTLLDAAQAGQRDTRAQTRADVAWLRARLDL